MPILVGNAPEEALKEVDGLFMTKRYLDMRVINQESLQELVETIWQGQQQIQNSPEADKLMTSWVYGLVDGSEDKRLEIISQIEGNEVVDRRALGERLRSEIQERYSPGSEKSKSKAYSDPKMVSIIRGWLLTALICTDTNDPTNRALILKHLQVQYEPDENARFWVLVGLYRRDAMILPEALALATKTKVGTPYLLALAIRDGVAVVQQFKKQLLDGFENAWQVLRVLRYVPMREMIDPVCELLESVEGNNALIYDIIFALSVPPFTSQAAERLVTKLGTPRVVELVLSVYFDLASHAGRLLRAYWREWIPRRCKQL